MRGWIEDERLLPHRYEVQRAERVREIEAALNAMKEAGRTTYLTLTEVMSHPDAARREGTRAAAVILTRAYDDVNGIALLSAEGLPVQAAALAAALWEKAHQASTVTHDADRLTAWLQTTADFDADNPVYRNKAHKKAFEVVRSFMDLPIAWEDLETEYRQLCNMKHAHPFVMRHFAVTEWSNERVELLYGPTSGGGSAFMTFQTAIAVVKALQWGTLGFLLGNSDLLNDEAQHRLHRRISEGMQSLEDLVRSCLRLEGEMDKQDEERPAE